MDDIDVIAQNDEDQWSAGIMQTIRRKTSSIWSPHLRPDRRSRRYSVWEPPSVNWSEDSGILGKRNAQIVLFVVGFLFPFGKSFSKPNTDASILTRYVAWMIGALLPLPTNPEYQMEEQRRGSSNFGYVDYTHQLQVLDESRYASARWWRNLNRVMSVVGLLIIGAVIALAVVGAHGGLRS
jgi:hypothetical protein